MVRVRWPALPPVDVIDPGQLQNMGSFVLQGDIRAYPWDGGGSLASGSDASATAGFLLDSSAGAAQFQQIYALGGTFTGVTIEGDLKSANWDGTDPADLSAGPDAGATVGLYVDSSAGSAQFMGTVYYGQSVLEVLPSAVAGEGGEIVLRGEGANNDTNMDNLSGRWRIHWGGSERFAVKSASIEISDGSVTVPGMGFRSEPGSGLYRLGANALGVALNGLDPASVAASASGGIVRVNGGNLGQTAANGGQAGLFLSSATSGRATTDDGLLFGVNTGNYGWIQAIDPGNTALQLRLNPVGSRTTVFMQNLGIDSASGNQGPLEVLQEGGSGTDAFMTFQVAGDNAVYFGLDGGINDLAVGGWSKGANSYRIWHAGNDGTGSTLDADLLDGEQATAFANSGHDHSGGGEDGATTLKTASGSAAAPSHSFSAASTYGMYFASSAIRLAAAGSAAAAFTNTTTVFGSGTTASSANLYQVGSQNLVLRSTSSLRYKKAIRNMVSDKRFDLLRPITFIPKVSTEPVEAMRGRRLPGLIAEEVDLIYPEIVTYDDAARPDGIQYEKLIPLLIREVQELKRRLPT